MAKIMLFKILLREIDLCLQFSFLQTFLLHSCSIFRGLCHVLTTSDMDSLLLSKHVCSQNSTILNQIQIQRATFAALRKFSVMFRSEINLKDLLGQIHPGQTYGLIRKTYRYVVFLRFLYVVPKMKTNFSGNTVNLIPFK